MTNQQPHPDCICQSKPLTRADYDEMMANREYDKINDLFAAGRFQFNDNSK